MRPFRWAVAAALLSMLPRAAWSQETAAMPKEPTTLYSPAQLVRMVQTQQPIVFLDVREPGEFARNHIPGALNMPQRDFAARVQELPSDALVIPYCNMDFRGFA